MPMDEVQQSPRQEDWGLNRAQDWKLTMCWRPKECFLTGKTMWLKNAYCGTRIISGPGSDVIEKYWVDPFEFIIWKLKGSK